MMQAELQAAALAEVDPELSSSRQLTSGSAETGGSADCFDDPLFKEWTHLGLQVEAEDGVHTIGTCKWFASAPHWCHLAGSHLMACKAACSQVLPELCA
jgi:hypothetical protein